MDPFADPQQIPPAIPRDPAVAIPPAVPSAVASSSASASSAASTSPAQQQPQQQQQQSQQQRSTPGVGPGQKVVPCLTCGVHLAYRSDLPPGAGVRCPRCRSVVFPGQSHLPPEQQQQHPQHPHHSRDDSEEKRDYSQPQPQQQQQQQQQQQNIPHAVQIGAANPGLPMAVRSYTLGPNGELIPEATPLSPHQQQQIDLHLLLRAMVEADRQQRYHHPHHHHHHHHQHYQQQRAFMQPPKRTASADVLQSLPTYTYQPKQRADGAFVEPPSCTICLCEFEAGEQVRLLPCFHRFHQPCIDEWLSTSDYCCPNCKHPVNRNGLPPPADGSASPPPKEGPKKRGFFSRLFNK